MDAPERLGRWAWMFAIAPVALAPLIAVGYEVAGSGWEKGLVDGGIYSALLGFMAWRDEKRPRHARSSRQVDVVAAALAWFLFGGFTLLVLWASPWRPGLPRCLSPPPSWLLLRTAGGECGVTLGTGRSVGGGRSHASSGRRRAPGVRDRATPKCRIPRGLPVTSAWSSMTAMTIAARSS